MAGCATLFDLRGASDTQRVFLCWVSSVHAVVGHVHFTSGVERLFASVSRGGIKGSCCSDAGVHTITKQSREYPNVVIQLLFNQDAEGWNEGVQNVENQG